MQLVVQRLLAVFRLLVFEIRRSIVAGPILQLGIRTIQLYRQVTIGSIRARVRRAEAQDVIGLGVMLYLLKRGRKIIRIAEELATRIGSKRGQRLL